MTRHSLRAAAPQGQANAALVIILVIILILIAGYAGYAYFDTDSGAATSTPPVASSTPETPVSVDSSWVTEQSAASGFSIAHPPFVQVVAPDPSVPAQAWRLDAQSGGALALTLSVPQSFQPQTNFGDAKLTVGYSTSTQAVKDCYQPLATGGPAQATTTTAIGGIPFTVTSGSDAGAGNRYDSVSYRTVHDGACYAIDYTIHYSVLENYPADSGITQFDENQVQTLLQNMVGTFSFS
jgi:hypothetical protein